MRLGRETPQEQDARAIWQERLEWMLLRFHFPKIHFLPQNSYLYPKQT